MKLTIKRSQWLRGEGPEASRLLRPNDGMMCCLGFYCLSRGYSPSEIVNHESPATLDNALEKLTELVCIGDFTAEPVAKNEVYKLMVANDFQRESDDKKEQTITALFAKLNPPVEVVFED